MRQLRLDTWSPLSYKRALGDERIPGVSNYQMPVWTGEHARRLQAYQLLQAYLDNSAREFLSKHNPEHREYGDPGLIRDTILDMVIGDDQQIDVDGADGYDPDLDTPDTEAQAAWELREWLRQQWADEHGPLKMIETERDAVGLGDGIYTVVWSPEKGRACIRTYDPGFYFPVYGDSEDDYPDRVHIAWEIEDNRPDPNLPRNSRVTVRRLTWELVDLPDGQTRNYPWNDKPSTKTCIYSDATWNIDNAGKEVDDLQEQAATYATDSQGIELNQVDLQIDFIPVVHVPNTVALKEHYGRSSLMLILQILDDLARGETQLSEAAETVANPQLVLKKASLGEDRPAFGAGETWEVGDGDLSLLDTSRALEALTSRLAYLQEKLERNGRTPAALLGRVNPTDFPSGIALAMTFGPASRMISKMRMAREPKYRILLRFLWRMSVAAQVPDVPPIWSDASMTFGSFMPADRNAVVTMVVQLRSATPPLISMETAIDMLAGVGIEVNEAADEIEAIQSRDFAGALALFDATSDMSLVADYLGVTIAEPEPPPEPLPPDPNDPNADPNAPPVPPA